MTPIDLIWIFIILSTVEPMLKQRALAARRTSAPRALVRCSGSLATGLIHRRENFPFLSILCGGYVDIQDTWALIGAELTGEDGPVDMATALSEGRRPPDVRIDVKSRGLSYDTPASAAWPAEYPTMTADQDNCSRREAKRCGCGRGDLSDHNGLQGDGKCR